jgi:tRNA U34 5-methylaminomethyl-2-thiouridine-forming methyltransferase MnmC
VNPAQLERLAPGSTVLALDLCVGTGSNTAALLERCAALGLQLQWWGIELDRQPLQLALADAKFQSQWPQQAIEPLRQLSHGDRWHSPLGQGQMFWGDARERLPELLALAAGSCYLVMHDAFSPQRCPQLWSLEFLKGLAQLLRPGGRLLTYSSAAAVRRSLQLVGLQLAAIRHHEPAKQSPGAWSGGTAASPTPLATSKFLRPLAAMEWEHLATNAAEPYRDPDGRASAEAILTNRARQQRSRGAEGGVESTSAWRRRWGLEGDQLPAPAKEGD